MSNGANSMGSRRRQLAAAIVALALLSGGCLVADPNDYRDRSTPTTELPVPGNNLQDDGK